MKLSVLLDTIADDLNDNEVNYEFTTWTPQHLRALVADAIQLVFASRPDLFLEQKVIELTPCDIRQEVCECDYVRRVIGQTDKNGRMLKPLRARSMDEQFLWTGKPCPIRDPSRFRLQGYAVDKAGSDLYVFPAPPMGVPTFVRIECAVRPPDTLDDDFEINNEIGVAAKQWVLFCAKMVDAEVSPDMRAAAAVHESEFWRILGVQKDTKVIVHKRADT